MPVRAAAACLLVISGKPILLRGQDGTSCRTVNPWG